MRSCVLTITALTLAAGLCRTLPARAARAAQSASMPSAAATRSIAAAAGKITATPASERTGERASEGEPASEITSEMATTWRGMRKAEVDSPGFATARSRLTELIAKVPRSARAAAATALMDRYAPDNVNAAAIAMFGRDPFDIAEIRRIVLNTRRSPLQRVLVRTYYILCRKEYRNCQVGSVGRVGLLNLLTEHLKALAGGKIGYGEQRLLIHLCSSMLSRYAGRGGEVAGQGGGPAANFIGAMRTYAASAAKSDALAAAIRGWLGLIDAPVKTFSSPRDAIRVLGHWDSLARLEASAHLARIMASKAKVRDEVWSLLADIRDETRAAAAMTFARAGGVETDKVVDQLVRMLLADRGVVVQSAAAVALSARADQAGRAIQPLLDAFTPASPQSARPGRRRWRSPRTKRTDSILRALASLAGQATRPQRAEMVRLAVEKLDIAPRGALALLKGLGPAANGAVADVLAYRNRADRDERHYIDRHVLPAIRLGGLSPVGW